MIKDENSILIVCTGNTCRSPMAEILLRTAIENEPSLSNYNIQSAGIFAAQGQAASENAQKIIEKKSYDLSKHRSKQISQDLVDQSDLILAMTQSHLRALSSAFPESLNKMHLFRAFTKESELDVMDPFGGNLIEYEHCAHSIKTAIPSIISYLKQ